MKRIWMFLFVVSSSTAFADWWLPNVGNTGPGPNGSWPNVALACEICLNNSGGFH